MRPVSTRSKEKEAEVSTELACNTTNICQILYTNIDTITNKKHELLTKINLLKAQIVVVVEVKPKNSRYALTDAELQINSFQLFSDIDHSGRGVCIYVHNSLTAKIYYPTMHSVFDTKFVEVSNTNSLDKSFIVGAIYRSPNADAAHNQALNELIESPCFATKDVLILGDWNYPEIDWSVPTCVTSENHPACMFLASCSTASLTQHVMHPTRVRNFGKCNTLDLVLTNNDSLVNNVSIESPIGKSDHVTILISVTLAKYQKGLLPSYFLYNKGDYTAIRKYLSDIDWHSSFESCADVESMWQTFSNHLLCARDKYVPKMQKNNFFRERPPWLKKEMLLAVKAKKRAYRKWCKTKNDQDYKEYCKKRNFVTKTIRNGVKNFEKNISANVASNPKPFWKYIKSKTRHQTQVADLVTNNGIGRCCKDKAEILNKAFASVFVWDDNSDVITDLPQQSFQIPMDSVEISVENISCKIEQLDIHKAWGPDDIHPQLIKECAKQLKLPLKLLFTQSLKDGQVPNVWKKANVTPLFKKGDRHAPTNYRPISLTSVVCKLLESIVKDHIMEYLLSNNIISCSQHGFVPKRSCLTQQIEVLNDWTKVLDNGGCVDAVFLDIMKAYDTVPHRHLIYKLKCLGFSTMLLKWVQSFLTDRMQCVVLDGEPSTWTKIGSGVPQGSVLGPVLFLCYINDLPKDIKCSVKLFADDTKIYSAVSSVSDCDNLQNDLNKLQVWSKQWKLSFHPDKSCILRIGKHVPEYDYVTNSANGFSCIVEQVSSTKDLGVLIDDHLNFSEHIDKIVSQSNKLVGLIRRSITYLDKKPLLFCLNL